MARRAMESLTERDQNALLLRDQGLTYNQLAEAMSVTRGSVGTVLARARRRLSERFDQLKRGREAFGRVQS